MRFTHVRHRNVKIFFCRPLALAESYPGTPVASSWVDGKAPKSSVPTSQIPYTFITKSGGDETLYTHPTGGVI